MKDVTHFKKNDAFDNKLGLSNHRDSVPVSKLSSGSIKDKYPVVLDDGRTIVFISDKSREREIRLRYSLKKF